MPSSEPSPRRPRIERLWDRDLPLRLLLDFQPGQINRSDLHDGAWYVGPPGKHLVEMHLKALLDDGADADKTISERRRVIRILERDRAPSGRQ